MSPVHTVRPVLLNQNSDPTCLLALSVQVSGWCVVHLIAIIFLPLTFTPDALPIDDLIVVVVLSHGFLHLSFVSYIAI